jgi:putative ABC transport system permease protein
MLKSWGVLGKFNQLLFRRGYSNMMKTRVRKILRDLWARKARTALVSTAIFIGVTGTIALFTMSFVITNRLNEDLKEDELVMLEVFLNINEGETPDDVAYVEALKQIDGVTEVDAVLSTLTQVKLGEDEDFFKGAIYGFSTPLAQGLAIEPMRLLEGGAYPTPGNNEVVIEQRMADKYELEVGDTLFIRILSPSKNPELNGEIGTTEEWTISGIVFHPYAGASNSVSFQPNQSIYAETEDAKYIAGTNAFTNYRARFTSVDKAEEMQEAFRAYLQDNTPYNAFFATISDPAQNQLITSAQQLTGTMSFLALLALLVSGFLVFNVINALVVEQKRQIGIMKTIGASTGDNFFIFSGIAFGYGVIGVIPALIVGILTGHYASHLLAPQINTVLEGFQFSLPAVLIGVLLGLVIPVFSALIPVFFGSRVKVLDAITDLGISNRYGNGPIARILGNLPISITIRQGLSNVSMKKIRLSFTVITLALSVGAFVGIFGMLASIQGGFSTFLDLFNVELGITFAELRDPAEVEQIITENFQTEDNNIINNFQPAGQLQMEFVDFEPQISPFGPPVILGYGYDVTAEDPAFNFTVDKGETLTPETADDSIVITQSLADGMGVDVGDTVMLKFASGPAEAKIAGIMEYPVDIVFMDWQFMSLKANFVNPSPNQYMAMVNTETASAPIPVLGVTEQFVNGQLTFVDGGIFSAGANEVIVSQDLATELGLEVGDSISLTASGENGTTDTFTISGIFTIPEAFAGRAPSQIMGMDWNQLAQLEGRTIEPRPQFYFMTTTLDEATEDDIEKLILEIEEAFLEKGIAVQTFNFVQFQNQFNQAFVFIQAILQGVVLLIALIGALGLLTTLSMSVFERQKEIGVMRSIGASSSTVATQFLTEGLVVGVISWVFGLPIAALVQLALLEIIQARDLFGFQFSVTGALIALVAMLIITGIASILPSLSAARKTVSEILRYQ